MNPEPLEFARTERILDIARTEINRSKPGKAIEILNTISRESLEEHHAAECRRLLAEAYMAKSDPVAGAFFEEAIASFESLQHRAHGHELLAREHFADYLLNYAHCPSKARPFYEAAKRIAVDLRVGQDCARIQMKIELLELSIDQNPELENFARFKKVAEELGCTSETQLAAWTQYKGTITESVQGLRHARNRNQTSEDYFRTLLRSVRLK
jgi:hypothetical protein